MVDKTINRMTSERSKLAKQLRFFDSNIWLGRPQGFPLAKELVPERMEDALHSRFVTGGLVSHWDGKTLSAQEGNRSLETAMAHRPPDLYAIWTALPLFPAEKGPLPGAGDVPGRVRGARIFPASHNFSLDHWVIGSLCEWLIGHSIPLFIWHTELNWSGMHALADKFGELKIVVETQTKKILYHTRPLFSLMRACDNVLLETSNFAGAGFIEYAVEQFGAERLIFGSFLPVSDPLVPMGMVLEADIDQADKARIAGGNLRKLVEQVRT